MSREVTIILVFVIYMIFMVSIGAMFYKGNKNIADYILGGRKLNPWVTAMSAQASDMSGWLLAGLPGLAYVSMAGTKEAFWTAIGLAVGTLFNWLLVAKRLRCYTEVAGNSLTLPDYFENRFHDKSKILRLVSSIAIIVFFLIYTSSMFVSGAKLFSTVFHTSYLTALIVGSVVIVSYTFLGGFKAVSWTDFFQGILMFFALLIVPVVTMMNMGGTEAAMKAIDPQTWNFIPDGGQTLSAAVMISALAWGLGYFGQPHILARFMAIEKPSHIKQSTIVAMIWVVITLFAAVFVGIIGKVYLAPLAEGQHETVFMVLVNQMFIPVLSGIFLTAILAAVMSTADSQLLVTSAAITSDIFKPYIKKDASDKELLWIGRISVLVISLIAVLMALDPNSSIFGIVSYAWAGLGAAFGPTILLSVFWKRMTRRGAIAGVVGGGIAVIVFKNLKFLGGIFGLYELLPAFIIALVLIIVISLADAPPSQEICAEFEKAENMAGIK